ncbi:MULTISPECIES: hypothetical protein [unclassified Microbacterium]|uniref:hypothetical protein n=1 Tax=unclassified Microbacterium TaxID=2609290 RepID=UPI00301593A5
MAQTSTVADQSLLTQYDLAAVQLACIYDTIDRIKNDPGMSADQDADADAFREARLASALVEFRAARRALENRHVRELHRPVGIVAPGEALEP